MPPRIRSIKPDAPQHRKVGTLSDRGFRLWVGGITQADDEGRLVADPEQLRVLCFGYHRNVTTEDVRIALDEIAGSGLIRLYVVRGVTYADFPSWKDHQRIDRPTPSKLPSYEDSASTRPRRRLTDDSSSARRALAPDRKGVEGKGEEGIGEHPSADPPGRPRGAVPAPVVGMGRRNGNKADSGRPTAATWEAYAAAFELRYGAPPPRNASLNGRLANFVKRVPVAEAPDIAAHYVASNDPMYTKNGHPVSFLLRDAERLRTEWVTGQRIGAGPAFTKTSGNPEAIARAVARLDGRPS